MERDRESERKRERGVENERKRSFYRRTREEVERVVSDIFLKKKSTFTLEELEKKRPSSRKELEIFFFFDYQVFFIEHLEERYF